MNNEKLTLLWEIPLALLSFLFYKVMKFILGNLFILYLAIDKEKASQWRVLSADNLKSPLSLPVLMTKGPRWNTHAIIGTLGPFEVKQSITLDLESANHSARSWIAVVYSFPDYKTIASIESGKNSMEEKWTSLPLKPGKYTLGLRYYHWGDRVNLPAIKIDEKEFVKSQSVSSDVNHFYHQLIAQKNWFYLWLHYYVFTLLRLRRWFPDSFVKGEYLPVGAPDTKFIYGYLKKNQSLQIVIDALIIDHYDVYLTLYDRSSLPLSWCQIQQENLLANPIASNGFYLLRIRPQSPSSELGSDRLSIKSQINEGDLLTQHLKIYSD
jgi:hypothetical protein